MKNSIPIYTIGHSTRAADVFLQLLQQYGIKYLADVRSKPFSRYNPQYNRETLKNFLEKNNITYVFMGDMLGGRPVELSCYSNGKVDYNLVKEKEFFKTGIQRLVTAYDKQIPVAIMCSESNPAQCHRSKLITPALMQIQVAVQHITENGILKSQEDIMQEINNDQSGLLF